MQACAMSYKTILVHVDQSRHAPARIALAARVARLAGAHLVGSAFSAVSRYAEAGALAANWPQLRGACEQLRQAASTSLAAFERSASGAGVADCSQRLLDDDAEGGLLLQARYADLVVLSQTDPDEALPGVPRALPPQLLLHGGRPLLLVPAGTAGAPAMPGSRPLLAWDGSNQAARAITDALPLLRQAGNAILCVLDPEQRPQRHGTEPGADMALFLARHGVHVELLRASSGGNAGSALLALAAERQCDLLVMGGYGHQRARELLLGGATRSVLRQMHLPVLMSH
jgi:nucleotide-binding universal stress UspA family protein